MENTEYPRLVGLNPWRWTTFNPLVRTPVTFNPRLLLSSQEKPTAASGRLADGAWELLTGREKIESVRVELEKRE